MIQTKKDAAIYGSPGVIISGSVIFDSLGRTVQQGQPVPGSILNTYQDLEPRNPTQFTYDTLDRTTTIIAPDGAKTLMVYEFGVPPQGGRTMFKTTVYDPNNFVNNARTGKAVKISYKDSHERIVAITESNKINGASTPINTTYAYDPMGQIIQVRDDQQTKDLSRTPTSISYDLLGRRLFIDNPDTGKTIYTYDANGNTTTKETANLRRGAKKISYQYEYNRLIEIQYPDSPHVYYQYGSPNETGDGNGNLAGRIKQVTDESGVEQRWYGRLGETMKEIRQINATNNPVARIKYQTEFVFDSFGRMLQLTYPDGEVLSYKYDVGGLLQRAIGIKRGNPYTYIDNLIYDEFGQRVSIVYGNKVRTDYTYEPLTRRLSTLATVLRSGRTVQRNAYNYDMVGNILDITNSAPVPSGGEIGGPTEHHYTYDDLYQLTTANGYHLPAPGKRTTYTNALNYDTIGNITRKVQTHLIVGTNTSQEPAETNYDMSYIYNLLMKPHAVMDAGDKRYGYDDNGNMTGWQSKTKTSLNRTITWNEENRVKNVTDSGNGTDFVYDDQGERVIKKGGGNETVYVNRFYAVKNGDLGTKHIFANETRICTKLEKDGGNIQSGTPGSNAFDVSAGIRHAWDRGPGNQIGIARRLPGSGGTTVDGKPPIEMFEYFYHGDHLGSSNLITDDLGAVYQDLEYFPYGETWVEDGGSGQMPMYRFTGKELDPETGLYYFGARYYDPVLSRWTSADPALLDYLNIEKLKIQSMGDKGIYAFGSDRKYFSLEANKFKQIDRLYELAMYGSEKPGVFRPLNLGLYTINFNNPVKNIDPTGSQTVSASANIDFGPIKFGIGLELSPNDFTITQPSAVGAPASNYGANIQVGFSPASHDVGPKTGSVSETCFGSP